MQTAIDLIGTVPLFETLAPEIQQRIEASTRIVSAEPGKLLSQQGAMPEVLHILIEGQVALSSTAADGTTALIEVLHPIDHFVLASVLAQLPYLMSARAVTRCRLLSVDANALLELVELEAPLANRLLRVVSRDFRAMVRQVRDLKLRTAARRLGCYLLACVKDPSAQEAQFRLPFDKRLLAARLGCRQENLSRAFATLRACGVETHGSRVILHDIPKLRALAVPDETGDPEAL